MKAFFYKLWMRRNHTKISSSVTLIGIPGITIGNYSQINPYCYLKSEPPNGELIIGNHVVINRFSHISAKNSKVKINDFSYVGYNNWIGGQGNITIEQNFISGMNVVIISSNHDYRNISIPYYKGEEIKRDIFIGKHVWIGANSVILPGVSIGDGVVIGAGSIVTGNIPSNVIVAGSPAQAIKQIDQPIEYRIRRIVQHEHI